MRSDHHLSGNPMDGPSARQERAMEVAARANRLYRPEPLRRVRFTDVLARLARKSYEHGDFDNY